MCRFNFAADFVVLLLFLQRSDLAVTEDDAFTRHLLLKDFQSLPEVLQVVTQPDGPDTTARNKDTHLA